MGREIEIDAERHTVEEECVDIGFLGMIGM